MPDHTSRRDFLRTVTAAVGGALVTSGVAGCAGGREPQTGSTSDAARGGDSASAVRPIGVQLYTVRTLMQNDVDATLAAIADIGYDEVEFAGYFDREPQALRATLDRVGLTAPSVHHPLEALRGNLTGVLESAQVLGHRWIVVPWVPESDRTLAGYRRLARDFNTWGAACRERGLRFAYHNHDFEFSPVEGRVPLDLLLTETDPQNVAFELDLFWITAGGRDSLEYFEKYAGRFPLWHVKDMRGLTGDRQMVSVGEGDIDFARIFGRAQQAGLEHFFVEHDQPRDPLASVRASYEHLRQLLA